MNKVMFFVLIGFVSLIAILQISCKDSNKSAVDNSKSPIVTVYDQTLYWAELQNVLQDNLSAEDSTAVADAYIRKWIDNVLMYEKARRNIVDKEKINSLVEDYRETLIVYSYQENLLRTKLEKDISEDKLNEYYNSNKSYFSLNEPIIKGLYLKIPVESPQLNNFKKWYKEGNEKAVESIEKYTLQNAIGYEYFYNKWVSFSDIMNMVPQQVENTDQYLKGNMNIEVTDSSFVYLLNVKEYKLSGDVSPFDYVRDDVVRAMQEKERNNYMNQIRGDLYNKALSSEEIKFHNK